MSRKKKKERSEGKFVEFLNFLGFYGEVMTSFWLQVVSLVRSADHLQRLMQILPENFRLLPKHRKLMRLAVQDFYPEGADKGAEPRPESVQLLLNQIAWPRMGQYYRNALDDGRISAPAPFGCAGVSWTEVATFFDAEQPYSCFPKEQFISARICNYPCRVTITVRVAVEISSKRELVTTSRILDLHVRIFFSDESLTEPITRQLFKEVIQPLHPFTDVNNPKATSCRCELGFILDASPFQTFLCFNPANQANKSNHPAFFAVSDGALIWETLKFELAKKGLKLESSLQIRVARDSLV